MSGIGRCGLFLLVMLSLPLGAQAKPPHKTTAKERATARVSKAMLERMEWMADWACVDLGLLSPSLLTLIQRYDPIPPGKILEGFRYIELRWMPEWILALSIAIFVDESLFAELDALPEGKRPLTTVFTFGAKQHALRVSDWQKADYRNGRLYRHANLSDLQLYYTSAGTRTRTTVASTSSRSGCRASGMHG